jgi:hypothetical protein
VRRRDLDLECCNSYDLRLNLHHSLAIIFMSRKFKIRDQEAVHFVTFTIIHWLDVFIRAEYRDIFLDSIRYCQRTKDLKSMPIVL